MKSIVVAASGLWLWSSVSFGYQGYIEALNEVYPSIAETKLNDCMTCHTKNKWARNAYGLSLHAWLSDNTDLIAELGYDGWLKTGITAIEKIDSDGDSVINLQEILDITSPGDADDVFSRNCGDDQ